MTRSKILGHRGFSAVYPENTQIAFRKALELPVDGLEFDVRLTADEVPVVIHDSTLNRTTDGEGQVAAFTCAQIKGLNAAKHSPHLGFHSIPTLREVLDDAQRYNPKGIYNIEIKADKPEWELLVNKVLRVVRNHPLKQQILFSSFRHECLEFLKERDSSLDIGLLFDGPVKEPWYFAKHLNAYSVHLNHRWITDETISSCSTRRIRTALWTVDDKKELEHWLILNTDYVISNVPHIATAVQAEIEQHRS